MSKELKISAARHLVCYFQFATRYFGVMLYVVILTKFLHCRKKDERLWEVQRILTQLKRINRNFKKIESQTKLDTLTMESLERKRSLLRNSPGSRSNKSIQDLDAKATVQQQNDDVTDSSGQVRGGK